MPYEFDQGDVVVFGNLRVVLGMDDDVLNGQVLWLSPVLGRTQVVLADPDLGRSSAEIESEK